MKICADHWKRLKDGVESRGLGHLVAANGREAVARFVAELNLTADLSDYDPLMEAHNMIWSRALDQFGLVVMGDYCPVCELIKRTEQPPAGHRYATNDEYFIDGPLDAALAFCRENKIDKPWPPAVPPATSQED